MNQKGLCQCGCGSPTRRIERNNVSKNHVKGEYLKFISGHYPRGKLSPHWKRGYCLVREYAVLAEKALGKPLPKGAEVHHHSETELVICPDRAYHKLLHQRQRALRACGNANWKKCRFCKQYDDPKKMAERPFPQLRQPIYNHFSCEAKYARAKTRKSNNQVSCSKCLHMWWPRKKCGRPKRCPVCQSHEWESSK
jgi:hypothetical protein